MYRVCVLRIKLQNKEIASHVFTSKRRLIPLWLKMKITDDLPAERSEKTNGKKAKNSILRCDFGHERLSGDLITVRIEKCLKENAYM